MANDSGLCEKEQLMEEKVLNGHELRMMVNCRTLLIYTSDKSPKQIVFILSMRQNHKCLLRGNKNSSKPLLTHDFAHKDLNTIEVMAIILKGRRYRYNPSG